MSKKEADRAWWAGQREVKPLYRRSYERASQYVAMRDGVRLALDVYLPADRPAGERLPAILIQTRYYRRTRYRFPFGLVMKFLDPLEQMVSTSVSHGYAMVVVDVRGTGASFGSRPMPLPPEEVRDGAEVVDWIIAQPWSNGVVGTTGVSNWRGQGRAAGRRLTRISARPPARGPSR